MIEQHLRRANAIARGQKAVEVIGPVPAVEAEVAALHQAFWRRGP
jgi:hypothetical protein